jgi:hypothetical protein
MIMHSNSAIHVGLILIGSFATCTYWSCGSREAQGTCGEASCWVSENVKALPCPVLSDMLCSKVPRLCPFFLLVRVILKWRWIWGIAAKPKHSRNTWRGATFPAADKVWTALGSNSDVCCKRLTCKRLRHGTAFKPKINFESDVKMKFLPHREQLVNVVDWNSRY